MKMKIKIAIKVKIEIEIKIKIKPVPTKHVIPVKLIWNLTFWHRNFTFKF
jgi:hypothetical protein